MILNRIVFCLLLGCLLPSAAAHAQPLEIIELKHRPAEEVVPLLRPFLAPGGTLSGQSGQLFVRTTPDNLVELRKLLASLDRPVRQLQITVLQGEAVRLAEDDVRINADTRIGGHGQVSIGEGAPRDSVGMRIRRGRSRSRSEDVQRVRVVEGGTATIYLGQSIPLGGRVTTTTPGGVQSTDTVEYREVVTGFSVVPHISGQRVTLEIGAQRDRPSPSGGGGIEVQGVHTTISGQLGAWIEIGGVANLDDDRRSGVIYRSTEHLRASHRVLIRVEELP